MFCLLFLDFLLSLLLHLQLSEQVGDLEKTSLKFDICFPKCRQFIVIFTLLICWKCDNCTDIFVLIDLCRFLAGVWQDSYMGSCDYFDFPERALITTVVAKLCPTLYNPMDIRLLCPQTSPGKNTGVGCHFLLQGIFPTQRSNPHLLYWQADSVSVSYQGNPHNHCVSH